MWWLFLFCCSLHYHLKVYQRWTNRKPVYVTRCEFSHIIFQFCTRAVRWDILLQCYLLLNFITLSASILFTGDAELQQRGHSAMRTSDQQLKGYRALSAVYCDLCSLCMLGLLGKEGLCCLWSSLLRCALVSGPLAVVARIYGQSTWEPSTWSIAGCTDSMGI
jgi:hypothetical protein